MKALFVRSPYYLMARLEIEQNPGTSFDEEILPESLVFLGSTQRDEDLPHLGLLQLAQLLGCHCPLNSTKLIDEVLWQRDRLLWFRTGLLCEGFFWRFGRLHVQP